MGYIDFDGIRHEDTSFQDCFLRRLYGNALGRLAVKVLTIPKISQMAGSFLNLPFSKCAISSFIKSNNIDMSEYVETEYTSYNDFFMRQIKPDARPVNEDDNVLISPCDGRVSVYPISESGAFNIKNAQYTVASLLRSKKLAKKYEGGYCMVIRLCVNDYHRYCYVADGVKTSNRHIDGIFHTVNPVAGEYFPIYKENTREYTILRTPQFGDIIQMEVGALMVGKIVNLHQRARISKGQEKGHFEFGGSTVIVMVKKDTVVPVGNLIEDTLEGYETLIKQGQALAVHI